MALTQQQWYDRLKSWVPTWVFENEDVNRAHYMAFAKVLHTVQTDAEALAAQTFLDDAAGSVLDLHGSERGVNRLAGELDATYRDRIRYIVNATTYSNILAKLTGVLNNGTPQIIENWLYGYADDAIFADDLTAVYLSGTKNYDRFTVAIPVQTIVDDTAVKTAILSVLDENKALGVFYDVIYGVILYITDEGGDSLLFEDGDFILGETV